MTQIHWARYGERAGAHALLSHSSGARGATELTQYTDRPGNPAADGNWGPLFSAYPFQDLFVFLVTTPDPSASRAGMVSTRAALAPLCEVAQLPSLTEIFDALSRLDSTSQSPLELSAEVGPPSARSQTLTLASAIVDGRLPVLTTEQDYLHDMDVLWRSHPELRATLSFHFQFAPEYAPPVRPLVVATLASLRARWVQSIPPPESEPNPIVLWLVSTDNSVEQLIQDAGISIRSYGELALLKPYLRAASAPSEASLSDCRKALAAMMRLRTSIGRGPSKTALLKRVVELIGAARFEEILVLRNVDAPAESVDFLDIGRAVEARLVREGDAKSAEMINLLSEETPTGWWRVAMLAWLKSRLGSPEESSNQLIALFLSEKGRAFWSELRAELSKHENWFVSRIRDFAPGVQDLAREFSWARLAAAEISAQEVSPARAVQLYSRNFGSFPDAVSGFEYLLDKLGPSVLAGGVTTPTFVDVVAARVRDGRLSIHAAFDSNGKLALKVMERIVGDGPIDPAASDLLLATATRVGLPTAERDDVLRLISERAPALLLQLPKIEVSDDILRTLRASATDVFVSDTPATLGTALTFWLDPERLRAALSVSNAATAQRLFRECDELSDPDYCNWLIGYFTRTAHLPISSSDVQAISAVLDSRHFPSSAKIVADTVRTYRRMDVKPILARIEGRYGLGASPKRDRPVVLIATALQIERNAVVAQIPSTYDPVLKADCGEWPSQEPQYTVYTVITGAGNLEAQATLSSFLHHVQPQYAFFVGVAGAVKDFDPGGVAYCTHAYYYHGGKEGDGKGNDSEFRSRPRQERSSGDLVQLAHRVASNVRRPHLVKDAVFASGEVVLASNEIDRAMLYTTIKTHYNDVQIVEMEGFGFLRIMRETKVEHAMVLRGVSDRLADKAESDAHGSQEEAVANAVGFLVEMLAAIAEQRKRSSHPIITFIRALNPFA